MSVFTPLDIAAIGMVTPVGLTAPASAAAIRAGIARLGESQMYGKKGEPLVMGLVRDDYLPPLTGSIRNQVGFLSRQGRLLRLAAPALLEVCRGLELRQIPPLLLALPESWPAGAQSVGPALLGQLAAQSGLQLDLRRSRTVQQGRAGGLVALRRALDLLTIQREPYVLVGGVDTYMDRSLLKALDKEERLAERGVSDGFIPGEAAAFLLLRLASQGRVSPIAPIARISSLGLGVEPGHLYSEQPYLGDGLADAFREVFNSLPPDAPRVRSVYAGLNGERFWAKEWGVAYLRNRARFEEQLDLEHPVDCIGDAGAAQGPLMLGLAAIGVQRGYRSSPCLVWCSSDKEERAAALVQQAPERGSSTASAGLRRNA
ncbi:hypothetical protein F0U60_40885 [Archangium minus]|uniref:Beta-ketoacyl synthase N-terminal domain-containing protein n=1 Tax=Archangium minus TaxID=83450 RepID=A0ABY9X302_9BACT|nr:hypothetical protein F0U60_40885 [Archangium minus]